MSDFRIGLIVPSSNTTMETEIPAMLLRRQQILPDDRFSFHSSRMRMKHVTPDELKAIDIESLRCAVELADARVDALAYACLVAIMAQGPGYHRNSQEAIGKLAMETAGNPIPVITSAGALVDALKHIGARKISMVTSVCRYKRRPIPQSCSAFEDQFGRQLGFSRPILLATESGPQPRKRL
jgi:maleate isomerase